jgi:UDP-N-acetylmuramyl-tripeptide synthetase
MARPQGLTSPLEVAHWLHARVLGTLQSDSRQVRPGDGFVAWPGAATDGRHYVGAALNAGAAAVLVEAEGVDAFAFTDERVLAVPGLKAQAGLITSAFCGEPGSQMDLIAITGTNGKTSTAWWTAQLLSAAQRPCAVVGTLGIGQPPLAGDSGHGLEPTGLTTPDPVLLHTRLRALREAGVVACALEASSIGLAEGRLNGLRIGVAVFTNFTQDHLDFHGSMDAYWAAKAALFGWPGLRQAVVNLDDPRGPALASELSGRGIDVWRVGIETPGQPSNARLCAQDIGFTALGMRLTVTERDLTGLAKASLPLELPLVGRYNVSNLLCVLASARALGLELPAAVAACQSLTPVPGRMEQVLSGAADQPLVLVDYAHTPDALEKALQALQPLARQRGGALWVVVGCGGDRDASKRPLMAAVAEREAQHPVLTSDNPRGEDPQAILVQMQAGLRAPAAIHIDADRARAIAHAVQQARAADVVLIAGKGHEHYQDIRGVKTIFSDQAHALAALQQRARQPGVVA